MRATVLHGIEDLRVETREERPLAEGEVRVRVEAGGICGSDLHYFHHARMGDFPVREPFVLGHEAAGRIAEIGPGVEAEFGGLAVGDPVAINPSHPCGACHYCRTGRENLCADMIFLGSSRRFPHVQGLFAETYVAPARQCVPVPAGTDPGVAALAEPLSVCLHAASHAGPLLGRRVLVTGAGPIGALCLTVARLGGAVETVITDVMDEPLKAAEALGASQAINVAAAPDGLTDPAHPRGRFDVAFECSGNPHAMRSCLDALAPGGTLVQVGTYADPKVTIPADFVMVKELTLKSSFRFAREFPTAVALLASGRIDTGPLLSHSFAMEEAMQAFRTAADRRQAMKVQIRF
ncbi:MAG: L-idonate 5-dehydrogenase [Alphaproteobacteria bacterium]|nr:L-idonate 5-dehydrogenase [Alphaproteobacteria bacterium]